MQKLHKCFMASLEFYGFIRILNKAHCDVKKVSYIVISDITNKMHKNGLLLHVEK